MKKIIIAFCLALLALVPAMVLADALGGQLLTESVGSVGLESDVKTSAANVIKTALAITGTMFLVLTVAAGIMWMTAAGNEEKISKAKKIVIGATIGLIIIIFAYTITFFVTSRVQGATTTSGESGTCSGQCKTSCTSGGSTYMPSACGSSTPWCCVSGELP